MKIEPGGWTAQPRRGGFSLSRDTASSKMRLRVALGFVAVLLFLALSKWQPLTGTGKEGQRRRLVDHPQHPPSPSSTTKSNNESSKRVAICASDGFRPSIFANADLFHKHLAEPLDADVFIVSSAHANHTAPGNSVESLKPVLEKLYSRSNGFDFGTKPWRFNLDKMGWEEDGTVLGEMDWTPRPVKPKWGRLMEVLVFPMKEPEEYTKMFAHLDANVTKALAELGSGNGIAPAFNVRGSALINMEAKRRCRNAILRGEQTRSQELNREFKYDYIIWTRTQSVHYLPFPPLSALLEPENNIYVPTEENYSGLNDRMAMFPRPIMEWFLSIFDYMANGTLATALANRGKNFNSETSLQLFVEQFKPPGVKWTVSTVGPLPVAVSCCKSENENCWVYSHLTRNYTLKYDNGKITRELCYKYVNESRYLDLTENGEREVKWERRDEGLRAIVLDHNGQEKPKEEVQEQEARQHEAPKQQEAPKLEAPKQEAPPVVQQQPPTSSAKPTPQDHAAAFATPLYESDFFGMLRLPTIYSTHRVTFSTCVDFGNETVLADVQGKGSVRRIFVVTGMGNRGRPTHCTYPIDSIAMTLRIYFDGEATPSVEVPLGPLFSYHMDPVNTWGTNPNTPIIQTSPNGAHTLSIVMPFEKGLKVTLSNDADPIGVRMRVWSQVSYHAYEEDAIVDPLRFRAVYHRDSPHHKYLRRFHIGHARGYGWIVGLTFGVKANDPRDFWFHGGGELLALDGESHHPRILKGTGGEDMFGESCWTQSPGWEHWDQGVNFVNYRIPGDVRSADQYSAYRFYLTDKLPFKTSFTFEMGRMPGNDISTVLMYYHAGGPRDPIVKGVPSFRQRLNDTESPILEVPAPFWSRYGPDHPRHVSIPVWKTIAPFPAESLEQFDNNYPPEQTYDPNYSENMTFWVFRNHTTHWEEIPPSYGWVHLAPYYFPRINEKVTNEAQPYLTAAYMLANVTSRRNGSKPGKAKLRVVHDDWVTCWLSGVKVLVNTEIRSGFGTTEVEVNLKGGRELLSCKVANARNIDGKAWAVLIEMERLDVGGEEYSSTVPGWKGVPMMGKQVIPEGMCE